MHAFFSQGGSASARPNNGSGEQPQGSGSFASFRGCKPIMPWSGKQGQVMPWSDKQVHRALVS